MPDQTVLLPAFRRHRECWDRFIAASRGRHVPVAVPYEGDSLPGYLLRLGQPQELFDALPGEKVLVPFTRAWGANYHCEPLARGLVSLRMNDFFAAQLARAGGRR